MNYAGWCMASVLIGGSTRWKRPTKRICIRTKLRRFTNTVPLAKLVRECLRDIRWPCRQPGMSLFTQSSSTLLTLPTWGNLGNPFYNHVTFWVTKVLWWFWILNVAPNWKWRANNCFGVFMSSSKHSWSFRDYTSRLIFLISVFSVYFWVSQFNQILIKVGFETHGDCVWCQEFAWPN